MDGSQSNKRIDALTGIRFFAVLHIFLFHIYAWYWESRNDEYPLLPGLADTPEFLVKFGVNGWVSTSFFFLLSGFILAYVYWRNDGTLSVSKGQFWAMRAARIYPAFWIVLLITVPFAFRSLDADTVSSSELIASTIATALLVQAWVPAWIPHIHWPAWTISVLVFLYFIMPWLMTILSRLSRRQMILVLFAMPLLSLIPTMVYHLRMVSGSEWSMQVDMLVANHPLVWIPYFVSGIMLSKIFEINRFSVSTLKPSWFSWGDVAFIVLIVLSMSSFFDQPYKFYLRQGLLMPLYMVIVIDLARYQGIFAKLFSMPIFKFLGETSFSIFIWQTVILLLLYKSITSFPQIGPYQHYLAFGLIIIIAILSTYCIEKPIARAIKRKWVAN